MSSPTPDESRPAPIPGSAPAGGGDPAPDSPLQITEERLVTILQATSDFVGTTDRDGRTQWINRGGREMLGIPLDEELRGEPIARYHPAWAFERVTEEGIPTALREGTWRGETALVTVDGGEIPVSQLIIAHRTDDGTVAYLSTIARDISEQKRTQRELAESEERFRIVMEHAGDAVFLHERDGRIVDVNRRACDSLGYTREELRELTIADIDVRAESGMSEGIHALEPGDITTVEGLQRRKDGSTFPVEVRVGPVILHGRSLLVALVRDVSERKKAERALRQSEERYRLFFEQNPQPMFVFDPETLGFLASNEAAVRHYGYSQEEFRSMTIEDIRPPEDVAWAREVARRDAGRRLTGPVEARHRTKDDEEIVVEVTASHVRYGDQDARLVVAVDVTERVRLEKRLRQAQKMEAIGHLAGGVAHDFNNLLTTILGNSEMVLGDLPEDDAHRTEIEEIRLAADRAASLTDQLLTFSRERITAPRIVDLNDLVEESLRLLKRVIEEDVTIETHLDPDLAPIESDPAQLHQVIMNLCVNARDAMRDGGRMRIATRNTEMDAADPRLPADAESGHYVELEIRDSGCGMDAATRERIFEPFFTTKDTNQGTGLGLATVYATVRQSGGHVTVDSEPGEGSTFRLFFPAADEPLPERDEDDRSSQRGEETVLLVEDDAAVREMIRRILDASGYEVFEAENGAEGLEVFDARSDAIALVVTDIVMPEMRGPEMIDSMREAKPGLAVVFISGYAGESIDEVRENLGRGAFLAKPFTPGDLSRTVREVLDRR